MRELAFLVNPTAGVVKSVQIIAPVVITILSCLRVNVMPPVLCTPLRQMTIDVCRAILPVRLVVDLVNQSASLVVLVVCHSPADVTVYVLMATIRTRNVESVCIVLQDAPLVTRSLVLHVIQDSV